MLARIVAEDDDETVTVYHCMNNSRTAHAAGDSGDAGAVSDEESADDEDDVLAMPYFLAPVELAGVVEAFLGEPGGVSLREITAGGEVDAVGAAEVALTMLNLGLLTQEA